MSNDIEEQGRYLLAYGAADSIVELLQHGARVFDPDVLQDVAELRITTIKALGQHADTISPQTIDNAVDDAIHRRRPRW